MDMALSMGTCVRMGMDMGMELGLGMNMDTDIYMDMFMGVVDELGASCSEGWSLFRITLSIFLVASCIFPLVKELT